MPDNDFTLSPHEMEILENFEQARHVQQMMQMQGWGIFIKLKDARIKELERQFWSSNMDRDATWAAKIRYEGIISFLNLWIDEIQKKVECLDPEVMQRIIARSQPNPADTDGDYVGIIG